METIPALREKDLSPNALHDSGVFRERLFMILFQFDAEETNLGFLGGFDDDVINGCGGNDDLGHGIDA